MNQNQSLQMLYLFQAAVGVYVCYYAIVGKGKAYENERVPEENQALYHRFIRIFCAVMGPLALINAGLCYLNWRIAAIATYALMAVLLVASIVYIFRLARPAGKK